MKQNLPYLICALLIIIMIFRECENSVNNEDYKIELSKKDSIILVERKKVEEAYEQINIDSLAYEKEIEHIKELRNRYPDDSILDSLLLAGQRLR
ncbi:MAG: hypothetical protein AAF348_07435 [Bacteroidota bacterium]